MTSSTTAKRLLFFNSDKIFGKMHFSSLLLGCIFFGVSMVVPLLTVLFSLVRPDIDVWTMLWDTRLPELLFNTFRLAIGVGLGTFILGTSLAWIITTYDFPGKRIFEWALILPLAAPGYVIAFVYLASFEYGSVIPGLLESFLGIEGWYPDIRGAVWVILIMTSVLYPYVYLLSRTAFRDQSMSMIEAARSMGVPQNRIFWRIAIPMARPSIFAGISLAIMESLADFGTVGIFSYDTFTTAIYDVWFGLFNRQAASQLAGILLIVVMLVLWFESAMRSRSRFHQIGDRSRTIVPVRPSIAKQVLFFVYASGVLVVSFIFPVSILVYWTVSSQDSQVDSAFIQSTSNTFLLGVVAGLLVTALALILAYGKRLEAGKTMSTITRITTSGYAIPGSVIAVGILIPLSWIDHRLGEVLNHYFGISAGLLLTGSLAGLVFAYAVRFMALGFNAINSSLERITPSMDMAGRALGEGRWGVMRRIHLTLLTPGLMSGSILVFIEVMKEMPATLLLRPFGFETLATRIWQLTSESLAQEAAMPSLMIVSLGLIPVFFLVRLYKR